MFTPINVLFASFSFYLLQTKTNINTSQLFQNFSQTQSQTMLSIEHFLPNVHLDQELIELIDDQLKNNSYLQHPVDNKFAIIGIFLPEDSILRPEVKSDRLETALKYEFAISVAAEVSSRITELASSSFNKKFPLITPSQPTGSPGKLIFKLNIKSKPDIAVVENASIETGEMTDLTAGKVVLVEGSFKPYQIPGSSSGVVLELVSLIVLGATETIMVASPTKRKIQEFLDKRKKDKNY